MTKNVSAGGGRGGRADRNLWRFVAHLEADIFLQLVGSLQILLILHLFFCTKHKTTETSRYFPSWWTYEAHLTCLLSWSPPISRAIPLGSRSNITEFCYGHHWCGNEGSGRFQALSGVTGHRLHSFSVQVTGDSWDRSSWASFFKLHVFFLLLTVCSIPWHGNSELSCFYLNNFFFI